MRGLSFPVHGGPGPGFLRAPALFQKAVNEDNHYTGCIYHRGRRVHRHRLVAISAMGEHYHSGLHPAYYGRLFAYKTIIVDKGIALMLFVRRSKSKTEATR
jgi:hypothetical protein